ncbi:SPRY_PRY_C-I_1 domain-containing protein isoform X2 [Triplophysa rosa]|uniref:SPRY_PRY_C-I_1 domain-containing protein isoform X2 n=1 Tax=Triplophysa rosa TaxID=992332 RepID=UPI0025463785|nr:SPRY_PRY_C-I_1 domain-containing protein isoform X2 [Triplophysa rosa]
MACAAGAQNSGITLSERSVRETHKKTIQNVCSSCPLIKPCLRDQIYKGVIKLFAKFDEVCPQQFNKCASSNEKDSLSLDETKDIIRELAVELNRVLQFKKFYQMSGKMKNKGTEEEQQYYILHWADELETKQKNQKEVKLLESRLESEMKWTKAKKVLSDWVWKLKEVKENSVCPTKEFKETLKDLNKQCKKGESSILPVMDWMMWTVLQSQSSEDSSPRLWMKKKQISKNTAAVGLPIPNSVWDWITKSTASVVLDPNTANPDLQVYENRKSVIASKYSNEKNNWNGFERKRSKYDGWNCVQAKEGYNTGRHYWEVDVRKKHEWRVGVVKESALRNGYVNMTTKMGYWNLRLQLGTVIALTEPATKLYLPTPSKLGAYLDIDEGQVSFYDAEKRRHIYTFITDFSGTENIYPMFGTIETDRELVIL